MKSTSVRGTPINHVGPAGALVGNREGFTPSTAYGAKTVSPQYAGSGIDTAKDPRSGTPFQDSDGNVDEFSRTVSSGKYGVVLGAGGIDHNDPKQNGSGVILDGATRQNGYAAKPAAGMDSPVSRDAPIFDGRTIEQENRAHLGSGNESGADGLVSGGGVMSK